eukprot:scaffold307_cov390-Prasinococcus_capsulatus_cf.AAC.21
MPDHTRHPSARTTGAERSSERHANHLQAAARMSAAHDSEAVAIVEQHPHLSVLENGRVMCAITKHEMPCRKDLIEQHLGGKKYKKGLAKFGNAVSSSQSAQEDPFAQFQPHLIQSPDVQDKLLCKITGRHVPKNVDACWKHMMGRRFTSGLELREQRTKLKKEGKSMEEIDRLCGKHPEPKSYSATKVRKPKPTKRVPKRNEDDNAAEDMEADDDGPVERGGEEVGFWMPPDVSVLAQLRDGAPAVRGDEREEDEAVEVFHVTDFEKLGVNIDELEVAKMKRKEIEQRRKKREEKQKLLAAVEQKSAEGNGASVGTGDQPRSSKRQARKVVKKHRQPGKRPKAGLVDEGGT